jgi:hypothetical protein
MVNIECSERKKLGKRTSLAADIFKNFGHYKSSNIIEDWWKLLLLFNIKSRCYNTGESFASMFGLTLMDSSNKLSGVVREYELLNITKANQSQEGYDILAHPVLGSTNEKLTCYITVKLGLSSNDTQYNMNVNASAESFIQTMIEHLKLYPNSTVDDMSNIYFIMYNWGLDINIGNHTYNNDHQNYQSNLRNQLLQYINVYMKEINGNNNNNKTTNNNNINNDNKTTNINNKNNHSHDTINLFIDKYYNSNVFIVTKYEMKDWLIPSIIPLGDLFSNIVKSDNE